MKFKLVIDSVSPEIELLIVTEIINAEGSDSIDIIYEQGLHGKVSLYDKDNKLIIEGTNNEINRYLARTINTALYGGTSLHERTEVDHWMSYSMQKFTDVSTTENKLNYINNILITRTWLVNKRLTLADVYLFCFLRNQEYIKHYGKAYTNITRWYKHMQSLPAFKNALHIVKDIENSTSSEAKNTMPEKEKSVVKQTNMKKQEGKFIDLPGAEMGKVVVRFPPEASGYLHIGHAKAALLNQYYAEAFQGKLIMRFDDTNPAKETVEFEEAILQDLEWLEIKPDKFTHTSDYFDLLEKYCTKLISNGKAFVDNTPAHIMKKQRDGRLKSENRDNSVEKNLEMWQEMKEGTVKGIECCVRAKIDYESTNGCMRDPTIYRCKPEPHPRTGNKYNVYPTYDFACPIVDVIEEVTHTLRTTEYHDRDAQFYWILDALELSRPHIWEYSRLNMTYTVLSKRKLTWFVDEGIVDGWNDPRFPTVRGIKRRGMTLEGLRQFIIAQGSSKSVVFMEWDKIWAFNKKVIDPVAVRYTALDYDKVTVNVIDAHEGWLNVQNHPKDPSKGNKRVRICPKVLIEKEDAKSLIVGQNATFINWGNLMIEKINVDKSGNIVDVNARLNITDKYYKNTLKITWIAAPLDKNDQAVNAECEIELNPIMCYAVYFNHIMDKAVLEKDDDFKDFVAKDTRAEVKMWGETELKRVKKGEIIQLQRKGFFICDVPYAPKSLYSLREQPLILFHIPDGHATTPFPITRKKTVENTKELAGQNSHIKSEKINSAQEEILENFEKGVCKIRDFLCDIMIHQEMKLKQFKSAYNEITGLDYEKIQITSTNTSSSDTKIKAISEQLNKQINKIQELINSKADKTIVDKEMKNFLSLTNHYKNAIDREGKLTESTDTAQTNEISQMKAISQKYKELTIASRDTSTEISKVVEIFEKIKEQGDKVRNLKSSKADKSVIDKEVELLLSLKNDYKNVTGQDWKPSELTTAASSATTMEKETLKVTEISEEIKKQGDKVRNLKSSKADKSVIDKEVKLLLKLKDDYKNATGQDWKPSELTTAASSATTMEKETLKVTEISEEIKKQGDKVRNLKSSKADKSVIDKEVKLLLKLKDDYKNATGQDWKPSELTTAASSATTMEKETLKVTEISEEIKKQGDKVRNLKSSKADKSVIDKEVKLLLKLKDDYKNATGQDWKPSELTTTASSATTMEKETLKGTEISEEIKKQGDKVRNLKSSKADKSVIDKEVKLLLKLKDDYKNATGQEWKLALNLEAESKKKKEDASKLEKVSPEEIAKSTTSKDTSKTGTRLGLEAKKEENFSDWYSQVIKKSGMIEYYDISGCYILRPWSFAIWKIIKEFIDKEITALGVQECYFPIFVTRGVLEREKTHIADFEPEVAWVTKCGKWDLSEPVAIRPTSETVMYPSYAKWLRSDTELPLKLNQWNNVVRWEFKDPKPFIRTREFLWQEGHSAFASKAEAEEEVLTILDMYAKVYENLLAVPVIKGRKTEKEKFAGGDYTTTVEAYISTNGRAIQGATSHHLGQNFSKMFNIQVEGVKEDEKTFVYQNSWGLTTRTIGVMIMAHGDDKGLVLPPRVASIECVVIPCGVTANMPAIEKELLQSECSKLVDELSSEQFRVKGDFRNNRTPGWKFNHWELKGVPVRIELGPKDLEKNQVTFVRRDNFQRIPVQRNAVATSLNCLLKDIQVQLFYKAKENLTTHIKQVEKWSDFCPELNKKNLLLSPFCGEPKCEDNIKADSAREDTEDNFDVLSMGAKSLCIPFEQPILTKPLDELECIHHSCKNKAKFYTLFGRSY
ncbi:bifunctional glutamate/proline--tRNA ligase [Nylanderia fulva]|uniref:bifunctional glutamate/proline--tRNA ligase n=1 Tax=Nylanderia fulva TaxID=613905 RepID=UPI0010FB9F51|nr:bifunctional glutamate/proline--tRNA ligase [Nylanderia fulva]